MAKMPSDEEPVVVRLPVEVTVTSSPSAWIAAAYLPVVEILPVEETVLEAGTPRTAPPPSKVTGPIAAMPLPPIAFTVMLPTEVTTFFCPAANTALATELPISRDRLPSDWMVGVPFDPAKIAAPPPEGAVTDMFPVFLTVALVSPWANNPCVALG